MSCFGSLAYMNMQFVIIAILFITAQMFESENL